MRRFEARTKRVFYCTRIVGEMVIHITTLYLITIV